MVSWMYLIKNPGPVGHRSIISSNIVIIVPVYGNYIQLSSSSGRKIPGSPLHNLIDDARKIC